MIANVNPGLQSRHVPHYIANSLGLITTNYDPSNEGVDPLTGELIGSAPGDLSSDTSDPSSWYNVLGQLQEWNSDLKAAETAFRSYIQSLQSQGLPVTTPELQADSRGLLDNRQKYNQASGMFIDAYRTVFGSVPTGLSGVGLGFDPGTALTFAAVLTVVIAAIAIGWQYARGYRAKYEAALANANASAGLNSAAQQKLNQAAAADAAGNHDQAAQLRSDAQTLMNQANNVGAGGGLAIPQNWGKWIQDNAMMLAGVGVAALVVVPRVLGGRR